MKITKCFRILSLASLFLLASSTAFPQATQTNSYKAQTPASTTRPSAAAAPKTVRVNLVDINSASVDELDGVPGLGPDYAQKVIQGRPYKTKRDLLQKKIVTPEVYAKIQDKIIAKQKK